jgi:hypothetical protein
MRRLRRSGKSLRAIAEDMKERGIAISHVGVKKIAEGAASSPFGQGAGDPSASRSDAA